MSEKIFTNFLDIRVRLIKNKMLDFNPRFKPPSTSDIAKFKQEIGLQLPADYVHFLQRINGGFIGAHIKALNDSEA